MRHNDQTRFSIAVGLHCSSQQTVRRQRAKRGIHVIDRAPSSSEADRLRPVVDAGAVSRAQREFRFFAILTYMDASRFGK